MDVVVPVKPFANGKQRLAAVLSPSERFELCRMMCSWMLAELAKVASINRIVVVSTEPELKAMARAHCFHLLDMGTAARNLNFDVNFALHQMSRAGGNDACVIHSDLPLVTSDAFVEVMSAHASGPDRKLTLVTDRGRKGTNVRFCRPVDLVPCMYGRSSFVDHAFAAASLAVSVDWHSSVALEHDLDDVSDILAIIQRVRDFPQSSPTIEFLKHAEARLRRNGVDHELFV